MNKYPELAIPQVEVSLKKIDKKDYVFDPVRKKDLILTEEEWVRQHFLLFLMQYLKFPKSLIRTESQHQAGSRQKRTDILVYDRDLKPLVLVECKGFNVTLKRKVFEQAIEYNKSLETKCIILTNGMMHFCCVKDAATGNYVELDYVPAFTDLQPD